MIWNRKVKEANTFYSTGNINDMGLEWQEVQFFLLEIEDLRSSAARGTNLRNSSCVSLKSGQVLVFWKVSLGLWSSF